MRVVRKLIPAALLLAGAAWFALRPYKGFEKDVVVTIPRGSTTRAMAETLEANGVVRHRWLFLAARALNRNVTLQAGEYHFIDPAAPHAVLARIAHGDVLYYELTVPEGSNMFDVATAAGKLGLFDAGSFLRAARDPALVRDLAPKAANLEGYLFPSTYRLTRDTDARRLCKMMTAQFRSVWRQLTPGKADVHATVTMASLVEKETGNPAERARVSSVFHNRLDKSMRLQCDPTTIYAALLGGTWRGKIHRSDLDSTHPYNTYQSAGLPPGPIANPGRSSLEAALRPEKSDVLYFVAKPGSTREHQFSATRAEHEQAVAAYRHGRQAQQQTKAPPAVPGGAKPRRG